MKELVRACLRLCTLEHVLEEMENNPVTTGLIVLFLLLFFIEFGVAYGTSADAYHYWFRATPSLSPGLLLGIISHSVAPGFRTHVVANGFLLFIFGRLIEQHQSRLQYIGLFVVVGFLTTVGQLAYKLTTGVTGPSAMGASGSIAAFAAVNAFWLGAKLYYDETVDAAADILLFATSVGFLIWWLGELIVPGMGGPRTGSISHTLGILLGMVYGLMTVCGVLNTRKIPKLINPIGEFSRTMDRHRLRSIISTIILFGGLGAATLYVARIYPFLPLPVPQVLYPYLPSPIPADEVDSVSFLKVIVPGIASFVLALLYVNMSGIQAQQARLQNTQKEIQEAEHEPHINVHDIDPDGDTVSLELKNVGEGLAKELSINTHVYIRELGTDGISYSIGEPNYQNRLFKTNSGNLITSLSSGESGDFSANIYLPSQQHNGFDEAFYSVLSAIDEQSQNTIDELYLQFEIQYDHDMPDKGRARQFLQPFKVDLGQGYYIEDLMSPDMSVPTEIRTILEAKGNSLRVPQTTYY